MHFTTSVPQQAPLFGWDWRLSNSCFHWCWNSQCVNLQCATSTVKNWFCDSPACRTALLSHQSSTGSRNDLSGAMAVSKHCDKESAKRVTERGVEGMNVWLKECGGSRGVWLRNNLGIRGELWCRNWDLQTTTRGRVWMTSESMVEDSPKWSFAAL